MITDYQRSLMEHSLGNKDPKKWHRNHFLASADHTDLSDLRLLEKHGMMEQIPAPSFCDSDSMLFRVTDSGKQFIKNRIVEENLCSKCVEREKDKMRIKFGTGKDPEWTEINVGSHDVLIQNCFCGVGIETDQGLFGIAQRDDVIEILFDGKLIFNSDQVKNMIGNLEVASFIKTMTGLFDEASRQIEAKFEKIKQEMNGEADELDNLEVVSYLVEHWENKGRDNE